MKEILKKFKNQKIAVIGDLILDKYIYGEVDRISPEAPVPIVRVLKEKYVPGGAANVAANISTLGGNAYLFGIVGNDQYKDILLQKTAEMNILTSGIFTDSKKTTIRKTRVIGLNQQLLRIDHENTDYIETHQEEEFINRLKDINDLSAIIVSDYAKGTITKQLMLQLIQFSNANGILLIIDPKPKHKDWYTGSTLITPNKKEAQEISGILIESENNLIKAGEMLVNTFAADVIITAGADGMYVFEKTSTHNHIPTQAREVYDVSGAGDTVIATFALALSCKASLNDAAILANHAAGIKVGKIGTAPVYLEELLNSI
ncbi:MAG: D-glycero-beta-D-manno-heptose-7-phosphate kinase [Candidatus Cloacimonetes bacterium]|nr:D-glycero-beta-D-manno-heptose-7-phosphate kinase [Candidatus Cloacimonadota bacterium]